MELAAEGNYFFPYAFYNAAKPVRSDMGLSFRKYLGWGAVFFEFL